MSLSTTKNKPIQRNANEANANEKSCSVADLAHRMDLAGQRLDLADPCIQVYSVVVVVQNWEK